MGVFMASLSDRFYSIVSTACVVTAFFYARKWALHIQTTPQFAAAVSLFPGFALIGACLLIWRRVSVRMTMLSVLAASITLGVFLPNCKRRSEIASVVAELRKCGVSVMWSLEEPFLDIDVARTLESSTVGVLLKAGKQHGNSVGALRVSLTGSQFEKYFARLKYLPIEFLGLDFDSPMSPSDVDAMESLRCLHGLKHLQLIANVKTYKDSAPLVQLLHELPITVLELKIETKELELSETGKFPTRPIDASGYNPLFLHPTLQYLQIDITDHTYVCGDMIGIDRPNSVLEQIVIKDWLVGEGSFKGLRKFSNLKRFDVGNQDLDNKSFQEFLALSKLEQLGVWAEELSEEELQDFSGRTGLTPLYVRKNCAAAFSKLPIDIELNKRTKTANLVTFYQSSHAHHRSLPVSY